MEDSPGEGGDAKYLPGNPCHSYNPDEKGTLARLNLFSFSIAPRFALKDKDLAIDNGILDGIRCTALRT